MEPDSRRAAARNADADAGRAGVAVAVRDSEDARGLPLRRTAAATTIAPACPFLIGVGGDWRLAAPTRDHRCGAFVPLTMLSIEKQSRLCLTPGHTACATYVASLAARAARTGRDAPGERVGRWGLARTAALIEDTGGLRGTLLTMIGDRRTWPAIPAVLLVATLLAVGISGIRAETPAAAIASPSPSAAAPAGSAAPSPRASASTAAPGSPTPSPAPSPASSPEASAGPSVAPTPGASFSTTYTVRSGDTLATIATKFHTTISAIESLNGITDPRKLHIGQVLKIP